MVVKPVRGAALALFRATFGVAPRAAASAPGQVTLLGAHTDYNGGPVLCVALGARTAAVVAPAEPGMLELVSARDGRLERLRYREEQGQGWSAYAAGAMRELAALGAAPGAGGAKLAVASEVPEAGELGSGAALAVAVARALATLAGARLSARQIAGVAYRAEHDHAGVRGGIADPTIAALARPNHALLLECSSAEVRQVPFRGRLLLVDTGRRPGPGDQAFEQRRVECKRAVARLKLELPELLWIASWPAEWLPRLKRALPEPLRSRAVHVVGETARTRFAAELLARGRLQRFGELLYESHESCRRLYECSAPALDLVVAAARRAGALGAKLTGPGWGGPVLVLVDRRREARVVTAIKRAFARAHGREPPVTPVRAGGGARREPVR